MRKQRRTVGHTRMSHPVVVTSDKRLEIRSPMRPGMRILLALIALLPLLAPYELLVRADWQHYLNPFFIFAALISAGAIAVSAFFVVAAIAGLSSVIIFDKPSTTLTYSFEAPVVRRTQRSYPLSAFGDVRTVQRDWSNSSPSCHLEVILEDGTVIESGSSWSREDIEDIRVQVERFTALSTPCSPATRIRQTHRADGRKEESTCRHAARGSGAKRLEER